MEYMESKFLSRLGTTLKTGAVGAAIAIVALFAFGAFAQDDPQVRFEDPVQEPDWRYGHTAISHMVVVPGRFPDLATELDSLIGDAIEAWGLPLSDAGAGVDIQAHVLEEGPLAGAFIDVDEESGIVNTCGVSVGRMWSFAPEDQQRREIMRAVGFCLGIAYWTTADSIMVLDVNVPTESDVAAMRSLYGR